MTVEQLISLLEEYDLVYQIACILQKAYGSKVFKPILNNCQKIDLNIIKQRR